MINKPSQGVESTRQLHQAVAEEEQKIEAQKRSELSADLLAGSDVLDIERLVLMGDPTVRDGSVQKAADHHKLASSEPDQNLELIALYVEAIASAKLDAAVGMPRSSVEADEIVVGRKVGERQHAALGDRDVQTVGIHPANR